LNRLRSNRTWDRSRLAQLIAATSLCACVEGREGTDRTATPLVAAGPDTVHTLVVALARTPTDPFCSGVAIGGRLVLTAAHCVDDAISSDIAVFLGARAPVFDARIAVLAIRVHPGWNRATGSNDAALLVLARDLPAPSWKLAIDGASRLPIGAPLKLVGYGPQAPGSSDHTRRVADAIVTSAGPDTIAISAPGQGVCPGDSGSPAFLETGPETLVGILSRGGAGCSEDATYARVDAVGTFVHATQLWAADGSRATGDACLDDQHCATGMCMPAPDDPGVTFCTDACSVDAQCPGSMRCEDAGPDINRCVFRGPTPGAQGAPCREDRDCVAGRCAGTTGVCSIRCFPGGNACQDGTSCLSDDRHIGEQSCLQTTPVAGACSMVRGSGPCAPGFFLWPLGLAICRRGLIGRWKGQVSARSRKRPAKLATTGHTFARGSEALPPGLAPRPVPSEWQSPG
jgi:hypothetical protein